MHILIAIVTAIVGAAWWFSRRSDAARQGGEAISDVKGMWRSGKWSRQVSKRLVENLEDPREAGAVLLYQMAAYDGAVTEAQKTAIKEVMHQEFGADDAVGEELYAFARMATGQVTDAGDALRKLLTPIQDACSASEKTALLEMMATVAKVEGPLNDKQTRLIENTKRRLFPS